MKDTTFGQMRRWVSALVAVLFATAAMVLVPSSPASADGTETLGPATIPIAQGTGIVVAGTGLFIQPSSFDVVVPADAVVEQVILYWESGHQDGDLSGDASDETLIVNGTEVTAPHVGGPSVFYRRAGVDVITSTHRLDITDLGVVNPGTSTLTMEGLDSDEIDDGAGVVVIYSQGGVVNDLQVFDGNDIAFAGFASPRDTTVPQTYTFAPENRDRNAEIGLMATSTHTTDTPDSPPRPSALVSTVGGVTTRINDPFPDTEGREFDSLTLPIVVPAGATDLTVQMLSDDNGTEFLPASLVWLVGTLALEVQQFGSLVVNKVVAANVDPAMSFDLDVDCSDDAFDQVVTLVGGAAVTVADIPVGTTCTVSETVPAGFEAPVYTPGDTVTIDAPNTAVTITVTNTLQLGDLRVVKQIGGDVSVYELGSTFDATVDCDDDSFDQVLTLLPAVAGQAGTDGVITDIPIGTTCTVVETRVADPTDGADYGTPLYNVQVGSGASASLVEGSAVTVESRLVGEVVVTITNTPELPATGRGLGVQLWLAGILVALGALLAGAQRRRHRLDGPWWCAV